MSSTTGPVIVLLFGVGLQLPSTDTPTTSGDRPRAVIPLECLDSGGAAEAPVLAPEVGASVTVTELARERAPKLTAQANNLASKVEALAVAAGIHVRELVLRGDWSEEGAPEHFGGVVLDIFAVGGADARFDFWGAASEALDGHAGSDGIELSVMVHAC